MANDPRRPRYGDVRPVRDLVTTQECFEALQLLEDTSDKIGALSADVDYFKYMIGAAEGAAGLLSDERSADKRKWEARTAAHYLEEVDRLRTVASQFLALKAHRDVAFLKVELYRTIRADKRARELQDDPGPRSPREERTNR
jgi:hypothetical protein